MIWKAVIADDEPIARHAIVRQLQEHGDVVVIAEVGDGVSTVQAVRDLRPDLLFLDIQMPGITGLDVIATLGVDVLPATVFVTAYEQHAVRAFDANAVDYLVKPFTRERFAQTVERVRARLAAARGTDAAMAARIVDALESLGQRPRHATRIPVREDGALVFVEVDDIVWIRANRNTVQIHTAGGVHELRDTLSALTERLDPQRFVRVHRSAVVNVARVRTIHPWFNGHHVLTMDNGQQLRMSRYQHEAFLRLATLRGG